MSFFQRNNNELYCEEIALSALAQKYGTPLYVYSENAAVLAYEEYDKSLKEIDHMICFALKANSSGALVHSLAQKGCGADIVSGGELFRAIHAGINPKKIVYSGVGKTKKEIEQAIDADILMFNIESFSELIAIDEVAKAMGKKARISFRINPDVDPGTHPYVATGLKTSKFGIPYDHIFEGYQRAKKCQNIEIVGLSAHIGSQLTQTSPFVEAAKKIKKIALQLETENIKLKYIDLGGGLGIRYKDEAIAPISSFCQELCSVFKDLDATLILEPGRSIAGNAGALLTEVTYTKLNGEKRFVIVDAAMNDLARPSLYGSYHAVEEVIKQNRSEELVDIVGPICESGDFLVKDRKLPGLKANDLLAIMSSGAYGATMASTYNSRLIVPEVLVSGKKESLISKRGTYEDLIRNETLAPWQK